MDPISIYLVVAAVANLGLGLLIYSCAPRNKINIFYALTVLSAAFWTFCMAMFRISEGSSAETWSILLWASTIPIVYSFLYFSLNFPEEKRSPSLINLLIIIPVLAVSYVVLFPGILKGIIFVGEYKGFSFKLPNFYFYSLYIVGYFSASFAILFKKYFESSGFASLQIGYVIAGTLISAASGVIFGLFLPLAGNFNLYWLSPGLTMALTVFTAYAILKHHLFDIRVILTEILVAVMGIILACLPFLMATNNLKILTSSVFLFYCLIGFLLIKATLKEINAKELLEEKVRERTKDLQKSKDDLEQSKKVAEERARELEKWYNLTIGRELRMAELKEKIKEMENKK